MTLWMRLLIAFVVFCQLLIEEGGIGAVVSLVLLGTALLFPTTFR